MLSSEKVDLSFLRFQRASAKILHTDTLQRDNNERSHEAKNH